MLSANLGGEIREGNSFPYSFSATGFFSDKLIDPTFASRYPEEEGLVVKVPKVLLPL